MPYAVSADVPMSIGLQFRDGAPEFFLKISKNISYDIP